MRNIMECEIRIANRNDVPEISSIHVQTIPYGFLTQLGAPFLNIIYEGILQSSNSIIFVFVADKKIVGFSSASMDIAKTYRSIISKNPFKIFRALMPFLLKRDFIRSICQTMRYPARGDMSALPRAESLSTGVLQEYTKLGVFYYLLREVIAWFKNNEIQQFKVIVYEGYRINDILKILGFQYVKSIQHHGKKDHVYIYNVK